ncbi:MAG: alpha/beta hydrolase [Dehalococcoidia bacterium]|nr:alpha/beta hydrolase [Dehalococcoidia bacterium]
MPFAKINGFDMHYEVQGEGPPIVFAHGLLSSIAMAELLGEVPPSLFGEFTIIRYDSRGHGESGYTTAVRDYMWDTLAEDLHGLFLHLGLESAHLSGSSMGGGAAIVFALRHPEMVRKLVLQSPPPIGQRESSYGAALFGGLALLVEGLGLREAVDIALRLKPWCDVKEAAPPVFEWIRNWLLSLKEEAIVPAIRGVVHGPALSGEDFARIAAPTLLVAHPDDEIHPLESAELLHSLIPDSRLVVAPNGLHFMLHRDELGQIMSDFLKE